MTPTRRLVGLCLALTAAALFLPLALTIVLACGVVGVAAADAFSARKNITVSRGIDQVIVRGLPAELVVEATMNSESIRLRQPLPAFLSADADEADARISTQVVGLRRGRHPLAPVAVRQLGPLGLVGVDRTAGETGSIAVYPDLPGGRRIASILRRQMIDPSGSRRSGAIGLGTDFESIRDYSPDDDVRQINWAATQRLQNPMSNVYRLEQEREVLCLLDTGRVMAAPLSAHTTRLDVALDALVAVAAATEEVGDRCSVVAFDDDVRVSVAARRKSASVITNALFDVEPRVVESNYLRAFQRATSAKRSFVLVFTDLFDDAAAQRLVEAAAVLVRHHEVIVVSTLDPDVERSLTSESNDIVDVAKRIVSTELAGARAQTATRLRSAGIDVVEAAPDQVVSAAVKAYLRGKLRARL